MIPQFIFGGNTGVTAGELAKRRALAEAMLERSQSQMPRNLGEGIGVLGEALAGRMAFNRIAKQEREGQGRASSGMSQLMASLFPETAAPAEGPAAPAGGAPVAAPQGDTFANMQQAESGMDPEAVSPKGAIGLSQIMPSTARDPGYGLPNMFQLAASKGFELPDNSDQTLNQLLRDPELSTDFGRTYFDKMKARNGGSDLLAAASYNAGPGAVQKAGGVPNFPETQAYVKKLGLTGGGAPQQPAPQMAQAQPAVGFQQPQQAAPQDNLRKLAEFMSSQNFGFLEPEQKQWVADAFKREMNRANPDPMAQLSLEEKRLQIEKLKRNPQGDVEYGLQPIVTQDENHKYHLFQASKAGGPPKEIALPYGWTPRQQFLDTGTGFQAVPNVGTGQGQQVPKDLRGAASEKAIGDIQGSASAELPGAKINLDLTSQKIDALARNPNLDKAIGYTTYLPNALVSNEVIDIRGRVKELMGSAFAEAYVSLKGAGSIAIVEGEKAEKAYQRMETALQAGDAKYFRESLVDFKTNIEAGYRKLQARAGQQPAPEAGGGPQPGAIEDGFRFRGGNPADPNSWEPVQ